MALQRVAFACEHDEDGLSDILGERWIAHLAERG